MLQYAAQKHDYPIIRIIAVQPLRFTVLTIRISASLDVLYSQHNKLEYPRH